MSKLKDLFKAMLWIIGISLQISLLSCSGYDDENADELFFVENRGATMPVWVRGNRHSDTYILILHGGPGMGSFTMLKGFRELEKSYRCIYWDQRGAGSSLGNALEETFTIEQHVADLELLMKIVRAKYSVGSLFLAGHSWGGALGTKFLLKESNQEGISGWIDIAGGHNTVRGHKLSRQMVIAYAQSQIAVDCDKKYWKKAVEWYSDNPTFNGDNFLQHDRYTVEAKGIYADPDKKPDRKDIFFNSPYSVVTSYSNSAHSVKHTNFFDFDFTQEMSGITVPSLIIWGKKDMCMPPVLAEEAYNSLGTPPAGKEPVVYLDNSAHYPFDEENGKFTKAVVEFVEKYR